MDRPTTRTEADSRASRLSPDESLVLPSRRHALDLCRGLLGARPEGFGFATGPILVTGDAGVGKTWLWKQLEAELPVGRRWIAVDMTPSDRAGDFYRLVAHELGTLDPRSKLSEITRVGLVDILEGRTSDGERIGLVVEEAQNLSADLWEEVRVLANRLHQPCGFDSILLVGQTSPALRFSTRIFSPIETRLAARVHLGPIGVDEAKDLLSRLRPGRDWTDSEIETLHRDAAGNPRRLLRLAGAMVAPLNRRMVGLEGYDRPSDHGEPTALESGLIELDEPTDACGPASLPSAIETPVVVPPALPLVGAARPPIRVEENMIEVGWAPEETPAPAARQDDSMPKNGSSQANEASEESVRDHYAALQAWREWTDNQSRRAAVTTEDDEDEIEVDDDEEVEPTSTPLPRADRPTVRVEGEQKFAPFGQLFSKMAQARDPNES